MQVKVHNRSNFEMAIRAFRKKTQQANIIREGKRRKAFEKESEKQERKRTENIAKIKRNRRKDSPTNKAAKSSKSSKFISKR